MLRTPHLPATPSDPFSQTVRELLDTLRARYDVLSRDVPVGGRCFPMLTVKDTNALLDAVDPATFSLDERLPYWAEIWASSIELARWCLEGNTPEGTAVLDLGCGLGLAGIAAAASGAVVTMADYEEDALVFARSNAEMNLSRQALHSRCSFRLLDWRHAGEFGSFDLILGGDIVYERKNARPLLGLLASAIRPGGCAVIAEPARSTGEEFLAAAERQGFGIETAASVVTWQSREHMIRRSILRPPARVT